MSILNYHKGTAQLSISDSETHKFTTEIKLDVNTLDNILSSFRRYNMYGYTILTFITPEYVLKIILDVCNEYVAVIDDTRSPRRSDLFQIPAIQILKELLDGILLNIDQIFADDIDFWNMSLEPDANKLSFIHAFNKLKLSL